MKQIVGLYLGPQSSQIGKQLIQSEAYNQSNDEIDNLSFQEQNNFFYDLKSNYQQDEILSKNMILLNNLMYENDFNQFFDGKCLVDEEILEDTLRKILEKLDFLQGFQIQIDSINGFGIIGKIVQEYLSDECAKRPQINLSIINPKKDNFQQINQLIAFKEQFEISELILPFDLGNQQQFLNEQSQGICPFLSTISLPYRLKDNHYMKNFISSLVQRKQLNFSNLNMNIGNFNGQFMEVTQPKRIFSEFKISRGILIQNSDTQIMPLYNLDHNFYPIYNEQLRNQYFYLNENKLEGSIPIECQYQISESFGDYLQKEIIKFEKQDDVCLNQFYKHQEEDYFQEMKEDLLNIIDNYKE